MIGKDAGSIVVVDGSGSAITRSAELDVLVDKVLAVELSDPCNGRTVSAPPKLDLEDL